MLLPPRRPPAIRATLSLAFATIILVGLACIVYAVTACSPAPPEVLRRDAVLVAERKARAIANPTPSKISAAIEAKAQLARDLCCYEGPDGGADADDAAAGADGAAKPESAPRTAP